MRLIDRREGKVHSDGFYLDGHNGEGGIYLGQTKREALERLIQLVRDITTGVEQEGSSICYRNLEIPCSAN